MSTPPESLLGKIKNAFLAFATTGLKIVAEVLPLLSPFLPTAIVASIAGGAGELSAIASIVTTVEAAFANAGAAATGAAKLQAAEPQVEAIVTEWLSSGLPGGAKVKDQPGFTKGVQDLTSAVVEILNAVG
ncbi:MAG: hypothetical protein ACRD2E_11530 [Terriglobales bacterium]